MGGGSSQASSSRSSSSSSSQYYTVRCGHCSETILYSGYSKYEYDKAMGRTGRCGKCRQADKKRQQELEDREYKDKKQKEQKEADDRGEELKRQHQQRLEELKTADKEKKRKQLNESIKELENTIRDEILKADIAHTKKANQLEKKAECEQKLSDLNETIGQFPQKKQDELTLYADSEDCQLNKARKAFERDNKEVENAIKKTGVHSDDIGNFLMLTHGLIGATMATEAESNKLDIALKTFGTILNNECQDKLTIEHYFNELNLQEFTPILALEGYKTVDHLTCDDQKQFENDILGLLDKGIERKENQEKEDATKHIEEFTKQLEHEKVKIKEIEDELVEVEKQIKVEEQIALEKKLKEDKKDEKEEPKKDELEKEEANPKLQLLTAKRKELEQQKKENNKKVKAYTNGLKEENKKLEILADKEKERATKKEKLETKDEKKEETKVDDEDDDTFLETDKQGEELCIYLLTQWKLQKYWETLEEEGWDDADDWATLTEEDLENDIKIDKKGQRKKFIRQAAKWKKRRDKQEQAEEEAEQRKKEATERRRQEQEKERNKPKDKTFYYLKSMQQKELKKICLRRDTWEKKETEKADQIKKGLLSLSPVLGDFFGKMNTAIKQTEDMLGYKEQLNSKQMKAIKMKDENEQKLKAIEWHKKDHKNKEKFDENSPCIIKAESSKEWVKGTIKEVIEDENGEYLNVEYKMNDKTEIQKVTRYSDDIKSVETADEKDMDYEDDDETDYKQQPLVVAKKGRNDNEIVLQSEALITASIVSINVTDTMLMEFSENTITERGLTLAVSVEDCCKNVIKNQGEIRQAVFLAQEILKYKPANMNDE
eukprot:504853_1